SVSFVLFSLCTPRPPSSTLFPYTTLFRSIHPPKNQKRCFSSYQFLRNRSKLRDYFQKLTLKWIGKLCIRYLVFFCFLADFFEWRSEEHTSELQSRENLVCRLLLEKKKNLI